MYNIVFPNCINKIGVSIDKHIPIGKHILLAEI